MLLVHIVTTERVSLSCMSEAPLGSYGGAMPRPLPCRGFCTTGYEELPLLLQDVLLLEQRCVCLGVVCVCRM